MRNAEFVVTEAYTLRGLRRYADFICYSDLVVILIICMFHGLYRYTGSGPRWLHCYVDLIVTRTSSFHGLIRYTDFIVTRTSSLRGLIHYGDFIVTRASSLCRLHRYSDKSTRLECQHCALYLRIAILTYSGLRSVIRNSANKKGKIEDKTLRIQVTVSPNALDDGNGPSVNNNSPARQVFYKFELANLERNRSPAWSACAICSYSICTKPYRTSKKVQMRRTQHKWTRILLYSPWHLKTLSNDVCTPWHVGNCNC